MKLRIAISASRPVDSVGPWPRQDEWAHIFSQFNQVEFYGDDDDTSITIVFEVDQYDCYWLIMAALQFEQVYEIEVEVDK